MRFRPSIALLLATAAPLAPLAAPSEGLAQDIELRPMVQSYAFDDAEAAGLESFRMVAAPWSLALPIGSRFAFSASGAYAWGTATGPDGGTAQLAGPTDTDVAVSVAAADWLVLGVDATLSTGRSTLSVEESLVAGFVAAELLPSPITTWGGGSSVGTTVAMVTQAGGWGLGFAGGFRKSSSFEPVPDQPLVYDPGDQIQARIALDRDVGSSSTLSLLLGFQRFTDDRLEETNLFRSGNRLQGVVSLAFPLGLRSSALFYGGVSHRSQGTLLVDESFLAGATDSPSQQLFFTGTNLRMPVSRSMALLPTAELRVFRASDGASQGWVGSAGTALDIRVAGNSASRRFVLSPFGAVRVGNVVVEQGTETGFFGWEAGLAFRLESGR